MHVLVLGGAGMIGQKLAERLVRQGINGQPVDRLTLADVVMPKAPVGFDGQLALRTMDVSLPRDVQEIIASRPDVVFHLAAIVSGEAELAVEKGYRINLLGTWNLFEAIRLAGESEPYQPRVVFSSSVAVFGPPFPDEIGDEFPAAPLTSYGTQKAMCELLLADYVRKGIFDGIALRLPTVCIRPGRPNKAASGFLSSILREPLAGQRAVLPVPDTARHWLVSPRRAVGFLIHAAGIDLSGLGQNRTLNMPGLSVSVGEQIESLRSVAGQDAVNLIQRVPDATVSRIVAAWPSRFDARRALGLGFVADHSFDEIIRIHLEDEPGGRAG